MRLTVDNWILTTVKQNENDLVKNEPKLTIDQHIEQEQNLFDSSISSDSESSLSNTISYRVCLVILKITLGLKFNTNFFFQKLSLICIESINNNKNNKKNQLSYLKYFVRISSNFFQLTISYFLISPNQLKFNTPIYLHTFYSFYFHLIISMTYTLKSKNTKKKKRKAIV